MKYCLSILILLGLITVGYSQTVVTNLCMTISGSSVTFATCASTCTSGQLIYSDSCNTVYYMGLIQ